MKLTIKGVEIGDFRKYFEDQFVENLAHQGVNLLTPSEKVEKVAKWIGRKLGKKLDSTTLKRFKGGLMQEEGDNVRYRINTTKRAGVMLRDVTAEKKRHLLRLVVLLSPSPDEGITITLSPPEKRKSSTKMLLLIFGPLILLFLIVVIIMPPSLLALIIGVPLAFFVLWKSRREERRSFKEFMNRVANVIKTDYPSATVQEYQS